MIRGQGMPTLPARCGPPDQARERDHPMPDDTSYTISPARKARLARIERNRRSRIEKAADQKSQRTVTKTDITTERQRRYKRLYNQMKKDRIAWLASLTPEQRHEEHLRWEAEREEREQGKLERVKRYAEFLEWLENQKQP